MPLCVWWIKPILGLLLLVMLLSAAASVFGWFFKFPSLHNQVAALEIEIETLQGEINRLQNQVDRLQNENDRYQFLNNQLNGTVVDLKEVQKDLNGTVLDLEQTAGVLNTTKEELAKKVADLGHQNDEYALLNTELQDSVTQLALKADFFQQSLQGLQQEHAILTNTTRELQEIADEFSDATGFYVNETETLQALLQKTLEGFVSENDRLESLNHDLEQGLTYLNVTLEAQGAHAQQTLGDIVSFLGDQVEQQQRLTLVQLEISYRQLLVGWDCDFRSVFGNDNDNDNFDFLPSPMNDGATNEVMAYVNERVLSKFCVGDQDFLQYVSRSYSTSATPISSDQFVRALILYTEEVMKYYFPSSYVDASTNDGSDGDSDGTSVSLSDWIDAGFRCKFLGSPFSLYQDENTNVNTRKQRTKVSVSYSANNLNVRRRTTTPTSNDNDNDNDNNNHS